jgi:hypothetical protein
VRPLLKLDIRDYPLSKPVWKGQSNIGYETNHPAYEPVIKCNRKQCHYSDRRICEMMTLNDIATSTFLSVVCLALKSSHTQNMPLRIESTGRYINNRQVEVVYILLRICW